MGAKSKLKHLRATVASSSPTGLCQIKVHINIIIYVQCMHDNVMVFFQVGGGESTVDSTCTMYFLSVSTNSFFSKFASVAPLNTGIGKGFGKDCTCKKK